MSPSVSAGAAGKRAGAFGFSIVHIPHDISNFGEPQIALTQFDTVLICGPLSLASGTVAYLRSADYVNFERQDIPGGGGDCDVKVGLDNAVYEANLQAVPGSAIWKSTDDGEDFNHVTEEPVEQDRQWLAPDPTDPDIVYFAYHDLTAEAEIVAKSTDGGQTFLEHALASPDPALAPDTYPNTFSGPVVVDPSNHDRVYVTYAISNLQRNLDPNFAPFGLPSTVVVATSTDGGETWTDHVAMTPQVPDDPNVPQQNQSILGNLFPWISVDEKGNIYVAAAGSLPTRTGKQRNGLFMAYSTDQGQSWSPPIKVNRGKGAVVFPTVAAGADGIVDFSWIESTALTQNDESGVWTVHFAQSRNAHSSKGPTFTEVTGPVVRKGAVCVLGAVCQGSRNLLDFMGLALDSFGYAHMTVTSTQGPNGETPPPRPPLPDRLVENHENDYRHVIYWRQTAGPSANG